MFEFFNRTGQMALGSRLRLFSNRITSEAGRIYQLYGVDFQPKWFPVYQTLCSGGQLGVTEIARIIGHTYPSVIQIVKEMTKAGLVRSCSDAGDKRRTVVLLTPKGRRMSAKIERLCYDVGRAVDEVDAEASQKLWEAIGEWEQKLDEKPLLDRVMAVKVRRESDDVQIVDYDDERHREAFRKLNEQWIRALFVVEEEDLEQMGNPIESIISKGGFIYMAEYKGEAVGCFGALPCSKPEYDWELVKFAVNPAIQGKGIGSRIIEACLRRIRYLGGKTIFLESNKKCAAAVHLYEKYGFKHIPVENSEYVRADVWMERTL